MSSSLKPLISRTDQSPVTGSNSFPNPSTPKNVDSKPKDTQQSMQSTTSSRCCLVVWNKICAFFSAIARCICSLFGRTSPSHTSTTTPKPKPPSQTTEPAPSTATNSTQPIKEVQQPVQPVLPPFPEPVKIKLLTEPKTLAEKRERQVDETLRSLTTDLCALISAYDLDEVSDFPFETLWVHELLKKHEDSLYYTFDELRREADKPSMYPIAYSPLRNSDYFTPFCKYSALKKLQFVYELTHTQREPKRALIDSISLGNFVCRLESTNQVNIDSSAPMKLLHDARSNKQLLISAEVEMIHEIVREHLLKHYYPG